MEQWFMSPILEQLGIDRMASDQRLSLAQEIIDSVIADSQCRPLSPAQLEEIQRRVAEDDANPDDVIPAEEVHAELLAKYKA
jgi:putative addiction module component (TIGR02574 family)